MLHQVFVANPKKPPQIETILRRNKDKLLQYLRNFHNDKEGMSLRTLCSDALLIMAVLDEQFAVRLHCIVR